MLMCLPRLLVFAFVGLVLSTTPSVSHEFWIEPQKFQVDSGAPVIANLRNGQNFSGFDLVYFEKRTRSFEFMQSGQVEPYEGRMGDLPAFVHDGFNIGLLIITHETAPETVLYEDFKAFEEFAIHKGFANIRVRHESREFSESGFAEMYTRHAKTLISIGHGAGTDIFHGMETEFVALANPYTDDLTRGFPVKLVYNSTLRAEAQIEVFERNPKGEVTVSMLQTDTSGQVLIPVKPGHNYLLDAVVLRPAAAGQEWVWETLWASLTFATPN